MQQKRRSKKLMMGLGSTLVFGTTAVITGFGIKSLNDSFNRDFFKDQIRAMNIQDVNDIPNFNRILTNELGGELSELKKEDPSAPIPKPSLLFDTSKYTKEMHFGNNWRGQTLTPWGWLGAGTEVGSKSYYSTTVFLTGWNGELLWVNNGYSRTETGLSHREDMAEYNPVYDIEYDWNTDTVFVFRTNIENGIYSESNTFLKYARIDVLKGSTGEKILTIKNGSFSDFREQAWSTIKAIFNTTKSERLKHLYSLDLVSDQNDRDTVYLTLMPNFMQLFETKPNNTVGRTLVGLDRILSNWDKLQLTFKISISKKTFSRVDSKPETQWGGEKKGKDYLWYNNNQKMWEYKYWDKNGRAYPQFSTNASLIANPFNTVSEKGHLITHLIFAEQHGEPSKYPNDNIYHLYYANKTTGNNNDLARNWEYYSGIEKLYNSKPEAGEKATDVEGVEFSILNESKNAVWYKADTWSERAVLLANTNINRNMFDNNSVTFAFPFAALDNQTIANAPAFNVATLTIDETSGKIKPNNGKYKADFLKSTVYNFGRQSYEYWKNEQGKYNDPKYKDQIPIIYPWPENFKDPNWLLKYNHLVSVSPFDNTIIFAAMAPFRAGAAGINPIAANADKYGSFWIATNRVKAKPILMRPFLVGNDGSLEGEISNQMISGSDKSKRLEKLYEQGFTFDLSSLKLNEADGTNPSLNIYYSQTSTEKQDPIKYKGDDGKEVNGWIPASKIGLLDNVLHRGSTGEGNYKEGWSTDMISVYGTNPNIPQYSSPISPDKFSSLIHSRAFIPEWIKRSWFNINYGANTLAKNKQINPTYKNDDEHAVVYNPDKNLKNPVFKTDAAAELLSNWKTGNNGSNFNLLEIKQPILKVLERSEADKLFLELSFNPNQGSVDKYKSLLKSNQSFTWSKTFAVEKPSVQLFTSWSTHVKANKLVPDNGDITTDNFAIADNWKDPNNDEQWIDARKNPDKAVFGKSHNAIKINNHRPLRTVLRIKNPITGSNKPDWWNPDDIFFKWYPVDENEIIKGETLFKNNLANFIKWKTQQINLNPSVKDVALGLANLTIEAGLELNPLIVQGSTIDNPSVYKVSDQKHIAVIGDVKDQKFIIYEDLYKGKRDVYKQEQKDFNTLKNGGFAQPVHTDLSESWDANALNNIKTKRLIVNADISLLQDKMVRPDPSFNQPVIKAKYTDVSKKQIRIEPASEDLKEWFNNVFNSYNFALNLFVKFEYKAKNSKDWKELKLPSNTDITDVANAHTGWTFNADVNEEIEEVRFRLIKNKNENSENSFIKWINFDSQQDKVSLISTPAFVQGIPIRFDVEWINTGQITTQNNKTLDEIQVDDLTRFEEEIWKKLLPLNNNNAELRNILEFKYSFDTFHTNLTKGQLVDKLKELLKNYSASDGGIFSLWNGNQGKYKIYVEVNVKQEHKKNYVLSDKNNVEQPNGIKDAAISKVNTKVDLTKYIKWLTIQKLEVLPDLNKPGNMSNVKIGSFNDPASKDQQFWQKTFQDMQTILSAVGVKFKFLQWDLNAKQWETNWKTDLNQLTTYNDKDPKIKISFDVDNNYSVKVLNGSTEITGTNANQIEIKLNLPKLIEIDSQEIIKLFKDQQAIKGDTHHIDVTNTTKFVNDTISKIIAKNEQNGAQGQYSKLNNLLKIKFSLSGSQFQEFTNLEQAVQEWATKEEEKSTNELKISLELDSTSPDAEEFKIVAADAKGILKINVFDDNQNELIKKWLFGKNYEADLQKISVSNNNSNQIIYSIAGAVANIYNNNISYLNLEWADITNSSSAKDLIWFDVQQKPLPEDVSDGKIKKIQLRISDADKNDQYIYGPESENTRAVKEIDFSKLNIFVEVNSNWFKEITIFDNNQTNYMVVDDLNNDLLQKWEDKIFDKIKKSTTNPEVLNKINLSYQFIGENFDNYEKLVAKIQNELTNPSDIQNEILQLWDGKNNNGLKIKAKFNKQANNIIFVDQSGNPITDDDKLMGDVNTSNIYTKVNLINYLDVLTKTEIDVIPAGNNNNNGQIDGINPPANQNQGIFKGKTWKEISTTLSTKNIEIIFSKDKTNWYKAEEIKSYDPSAGILWLAIDNKSTNLIVDYKQNTNSINPSSDNKKDPLLVHLKVTKVLNIAYEDLENFILDPKIKGDTKNLEINNDLVNDLIKKIKEKNQQTSGNPDFLRVPLKLKFNLGNSGDWKTADELTDFLKKQTIDQQSRVLKGKFFIEGTEDEMKKTILSGKIEFDILEENTKNPIKIFIHNDKIVENLSKPNLSGDNQNLQWSWNEIEVDQNTGDIKKPDKTGILSVQYSLDKTTWQSQQINHFNPGTTEMWIKLVLKDANKYLFEKPNDLNKEIRVDLSNIKQILNLSSTVISQIKLSDQEIDRSAITYPLMQQWEEKVLNQIQTITRANLNSDQKKLIGFEYQLESWKNTNHWSGDANTFLSELKLWEANTNGETFGILQLWNGLGGTKINVRLKLKNQANSNVKYELKVDGLDANQVIKNIDTQTINTTIDLTTVYTWLNSLVLKIDQDSANSFTKIYWDQPVNVSGSVFFNKKWDDIVKALFKLNVKVEYRDFNADNSAKTWVNDYNQLSTFGQNANIEMKFILQKNKAKNLKLKLNDQTIIDGKQQNNLESSAIAIKLNAPKFIRLNQSIIDDFKTKNLVSGDTKNITLNNNLVNTLIQDIKNDNKQIISDVQNAELKVYFSLGIKNQNSNDKSQWYESTSFASKMKEITTDQESNQINMRFFIHNRDQNNPEFITDNKIMIFKNHTNPNQVSGTTNELKYFINESWWENNADKIKVSGTTDNLNWIWANLPVILENNQTLVLTNPNANHQGLHLEWTANEKAGINDPVATGTDLLTGWTKTKPEKIDSKIEKLWIRLVAQPGFVYGSNQPNSSKPAKKHEINLTNIKRIVKLESDWLNSIIATGNLAKLNLDEANARKKLKDHQILPENEIENIVFEYTIDGKKWLTKSDFEALIIKKQGAGANGFILRREELKMRFGLKQNIPADKYGFEIDGKIINNESDFSKHYKLLIDDNRSINQNVWGVINTNLVKDFNVGSFIVLGTNNIPSLKVLNESALINAFSPYLSDQIFGIQITTKYDKTKNEWYWNNAPEIFGKNGFEKNLNKFGLTITSEKKAAIRLIIKTAKYGVFGDTQAQLSKSRKVTNQPFQRLLDISSNVHITVEIENPFEKANKGLAIQTRENGKAKWKQGEGEFRIVVGDKNGNPENNDQSAQQFLANSGVADVEKLELVYKVFESQPSTAEINQWKKPELINNYQNPLGWQTFNGQNSNNENKYWSQGMKLKVGNYVMVALRVKKEFGDKKEDPYILKDANHSVLIPVVGTNEPGRIAGYKVDPNDVPIDKTTIRLDSTKNNLNDFLDGYTILNSFVVTPDDKNTIDGIELELALYNSFHYDNNDKILVSANGSKLVKRKDENDGMTKGPQYKNKDGSLIVDKDQKPVFMYTDPKNNNRLSAPKEENSPTRTLPLSKANNSSFIVPLFNNPTLENEFSLFKNQKIDIIYKAKEGKKVNGLPDFELETQKTDNLQDVISPKIKFAIENPENITYRWDQDAYAEDKLEYESTNSNASETVSGFARLKTPLKIYRKSGSATETEITAADGKASAEALKQALSQDFNNQLMFSFSYFNKKGSELKFSDTADIYQLNNLENDDRIVINIVARENDLIYTEAPKPLVISVKGLLSDAPELSKLQFLRVEQSGTIDGQGSFRLLINDPAKPDEDVSSILNGWKFLLRVWDKDPDKNGKAKIKINWTEDQSKLVNLANGDKVEWKLVDKSGNNVEDAYYNTVAGAHQQDPSTGDLIYRFEQVNYPNGEASKVVVNPGIGAYPPKEDENNYPSQSGYVIAGLEKQLNRFDLNQNAFEKIINTLGPYYKGVNGQGVLNFNEKYLTGDWWVNHNGDIYQKEDNPQQQILELNSEDQPAEISLEQFFAYTTFYTENPAVNPIQVGWHFSSNETNLNNHLSNNNQLWARFDIAQPLDNLKKATVGSLKVNQTDDNYGFLIAALPTVTNLKIISDPMSPLWWILVALGFIATFGTLFIFYWKQRHKKLKDPKI